MKKPINLIAVFISIILAIGVIVGAVFLILHLTGDKLSEEAQEIPATVNTAHFDLLRSATLTQVKEYTEAQGLTAIISDDGKMAIVEEVGIVDNQFMLVFYTSESDELIRTEGMCSITAATLEDLNYSLSIAATAVGRFFELEYEPYFAVYGLDGEMLDESVEDPVTELFNGNAKYVLSAIDRDETYWYLTIKKAEDNTFSLEFFHSFEKGVYENGSEAINLAEPKE